MTQSEIITELKQCKGNRAALEFAMKFIDAYADCVNCKWYGINDTEGVPCQNCYCSPEGSRWEWVAE